MRPFGRKFGRSVLFLNMRPLLVATSIKRTGVAMLASAIGRSFSIAHSEAVLN